MTISRYADKFLSFRCAPDVLGVVGTMKNTIKEITEMMGIHRYIKHWACKRPTQYTLIDLCSGNALVPIATVFSLPVKEAIAIDKQPRDRNWDKAKRFTYKNINIFDKLIHKEIENIQGPIILTSAHPCKELARQVVDIYNTHENIEHMALMPCCIGKPPYKISSSLEHKMGLYNLWSLHLAEMSRGRLIEDQNVLSPKNHIIIADKYERINATTEEST